MTSSSLRLLLTNNRVEFLRISTSSIAMVGTSSMIMRRSAFANAGVAPLISNVYLDAFDQDGKTVLMLTAGHGFADCVRLLLDAGADSTAVDERGETALDSAKWRASQGARGGAETVKVLEAHGAALLQQQ